MKKNLKVLALFVAALTVLLLAVSCGDATGTNSGTQSGGSDAANGDDSVSTETVSATVTLNGSDATVDGEGAVFADGVLSITKEGLYEISGTLEDGQIHVLVEKTEKVELYLKGVHVRCSSGPALYAESSDKVILNLAEGTTNTFSDTANYVLPDGEDEPNACIFSKDDLTVKGSGSLTVVAQYKNGISSKNDIKIKGGNLTVNAVNTAIRGKDSVTVEDGTVTITAGNDGLKSSTLETGKGFILVSGGTVVINAEDDGLQAENDVSVTGGSVTVTCGGKAVNSAGTQSIANGTLVEK